MCLGGEFKGYTEKVLAKRGISHYTTTDSGSKVSIVERAIKEIRSLIHKVMIATNDRNWPGMLEQVKENYNNRPNRDLADLSPEQISEGGPRIKARVMWATLGSRLAERYSKPYKYSIGNLVRIMNSANTFSKGAEGYFSQVIYRVIGRSKKSKVNCYQLEEALSKNRVRGVFYEPELVRVSDSFKKKLRKTLEIFAYRLSPEGVEEVRITDKKTKRKVWVDYSSLL